MDDATGFLRLTPKQYDNLQSIYITVESVRDLKPFFIHLTIPHANELKPQKTFELTANAQAWPRNLNQFINGTSDNVYIIVGDIGTPSGKGFDFIDGQCFLCVYVLSLSTCFPLFFLFFFDIVILTLRLAIVMVIRERYYSVYDTANRRVGLAATPFTYALIN